MISNKLYILRVCGYSQLYSCDVVQVFRSNDMLIILLALLHLPKINVHTLGK